MGWATELLNATPTRGGAKDDCTGQLNCPVVTYEALNNWHLQFLFFWTVYGEDLVTSIQKANDEAMAPDSSPATVYALTEIMGPKGKYLILFNPSTCLAVFGYGGLHFNEYSHIGDWAPNTPTQ